MNGLFLGYLLSILAHCLGIRASAEHLTEDGYVNFVINGMLPNVALQKSREIDAMLSSTQQQPLGFDEMKIGVVCSCY
jgi:hypothetical protein